MPDVMRAWLARQPAEVYGQHRLAPLGLHTLEPEQLASGRFSVVDRFGIVPPSLFPSILPGTKVRAVIMLEGDLR